MFLRNPLPLTALLALAASSFALVAACSGQVDGPGTGGGHHASSSNAGGAPTSSSTGGDTSGVCDECCPYVCDGEVCVACVEDSDCDAFGSPGFNCVDDQCVCTTDAQCADDVNGGACTAGVCGCKTSSDCAGSAGGPTCNEEGACTCADDTQCAGSPLGPHCLASSGECGCQVDADCASAAYGNVCTQGACSCSTEASCPPGRSCTGVGQSFVPICL